MQVGLDRDALSGAVSFAARALPPRPAVPSHAGMLLEATSGSLVVSAVDADSRVSARMTVLADVSEAGRALLPGRVLADIAGSLPSGPVSLSSEAGQARVAGGKARFALPLLSEAGYPELPDGGQVIGAVDGSTLAQAVAQVAFATQPESTAPALAGVHLEVAGKHLTFVATDRYRLAVAQAAWQPQDKAATLELTVPARALADAAKALSRDGAITVSVSPAGLLTLSSERRQARVGTLDGEYPRWQSLLPKSAPSAATLLARDLADALSRVSLVKDRSAPVRLQFADGQLTVAADDGHDASGSDVVECHLRGKPLEMGVNPQLLREGLLACGTEQVRVELVGPTSPALVSPVDGGSYRYLVMPVRLSR